MSDLKYFANANGIELRSIDLHGTLHCFDTNFRDCPDERIVYEEMGVLQYDGCEFAEPTYDIFDVLRHAPAIARRLDLVKLRELLPMEGDRWAQFDFLGFKAMGWIAASRSGDYPVVYISANVGASTVMTIISDVMHGIGYAAMWDLNSFDIHKEDYNMEIGADAHLFIRLGGYVDSEPKVKDGIRGELRTLLEIELVLE